jgi:hypothetical protein
MVGAEARAAVEKAEFAVWQPPAASVRFLQFKQRPETLALGAMERWEGSVEEAARAARNRWLLGRMDGFQR